MGKSKKFGKIGSPKSPKRKAWMRKIAKKRKRIDERESWRNGRERGKGGRFTGKGKKMNPALETVLLVASISREVWNRIPESRKKQIHSAVAKGQIELARRLARK